MEEEKPNYYAIIPAEIRYDNDLRAGAKIFYGEITALCSKSGICTASNNYFAELYHMTPSGISRWVTQLKDKGYINVEYEKDGKEIKLRKIIVNHYNSTNYVVDKVLTNITRVVTKVDEGIDKNAIGYVQKRKENNTSINNTSINNIKEIYKEKFKKPTIEEIETYCKERNNKVDASTFYDFYESKGWYVGKNKMKDWKAAIRTWEKSKERSNGYKSQLEKNREAIREFLNEHRTSN